MRPHFIVSPGIECELDPVGGRGTSGSSDAPHCFCESYGKQGGRSAKEKSPRLPSPVQKPPSMASMYLISLHFENYSHTRESSRLQQYLSHGSSVQGLGTLFRQH